MSNKILSRGDFSIESSILDEHEWMSDALIDDLGKNCILVYPKKYTECTNCYLDRRTMRSTNVYREGGPIPFENGQTCPYCHGAGRSEQSPTETLKFRIYWTPKDWIKLDGIDFNAGGESRAMIIGYMSDLPKLEKAEKVILNSDMQNYKSWDCEREGEAAPWGFRHNRYFVQFMKRIGGN